MYESAVSDQNQNVVEVDKLRRQIAELRRKCDAANETIQKRKSELEAANETAEQAKSALEKKGEEAREKNAKYLKTISTLRFRLIGHDQDVADLNGARGTIVKLERQSAAANRTIRELKED